MINLHNFTSIRVANLRQSHFAVELPARLIRYWPVSDLNLVIAVDRFVVNATC